jgi:hypothetical protein
MSSEQKATGYRRRTLEKWNNGKRPFVPAEHTALFGKKLSLMISAEIKAWLPIDQEDMRPRSLVEGDENA